MQIHMYVKHRACHLCRFLESVRRYNYTTPKSYLELISLYKQLLARKREELRLDKERLESGVDKIAQASAQVADLQLNLKQEQIIVEEKKSKTSALIENIGQEKATVDEAVEAGREDEEAAAKLQVIKFVLRVQTLWGGGGGGGQYLHLVSGSCWPTPTVI